MTDPKQKLNDTEIREAGLADWRQILGTIQARFNTGSFATGLALVDRIGAAAEAANHHPDITLTYPSVTIALSSHDVGGLTSRDVELARLISEYAAEVGVAADPGSLTQVEWGIDTWDSAEIQPFWAAMLGGSKIAEEVVDPHGSYPTIWFQGTDQHETPRQRWHADVWVAHDQAQARIDAALAAGGVMVDDSDAPQFWVLADPQGNKACICVPTGRG